MTRVPYYQDELVTLWHSDCLEVLPELLDNSADAVVTDPPYALNFMGKKWDSFAASTGAREILCAVCLQARRDGRDLRQVWPDYDAHRRTHSVWQDPMVGHPFQAWCQTWAAECLRILKPGGHLLAFGGTRTSHRLACAVEDAGFEIRDSIAWLYGSGFPKSLDVSKAIDRAAGAEREIVGRKGGRDAYGHQPGGSAQGFGGLLRWGSVHYAWDDLPEEGKAYYIAGARDRADITAPATPEAEQWQGWGTALKPAHEPIIVARKPLGAGTVAANVLRWGTGALNIDAGRIGTADNLNGGGYSPTPTSGSHLLDGCSSIDELRRLAERGAKTPNGRTARATLARAEDAERMRRTYRQPAGRWPANVALDESQAAALDQQSGETVSSSGGMGGKYLGLMNDDGWEPESLPRGGHDDTGGASRFYFTAKASSDERITHNEPMCVCGHSRSQHADDDWGSCLIPGCWCPGFAIDRSTVKTTAHPTVKPLSLMRWLVRLVTPPGGVILEPFAGSGTTVEAALLEGFRCIAIEREADYLPLITQRINRRRDPIAYLTAAGEDLGLFGGVA